MALLSGPVTGSGLVSGLVLGSWAILFFQVTTTIVEGVVLIQLQFKVFIT